MAFFMEEAPFLEKAAWLPHIFVLRATDLQLAHAYSEKHFPPVSSHIKPNCFLLPADGEGLRLTAPVTLCAGGTAVHEVQ